MKAALLFTFAILLSVNLIAQNDDDWDERQYDVDDFSAMYLEGGYKVLLSQGDKCALTIKTTDDDVLDHLKVENWGDELRLVMDRDFINYERIRLYVTFKNLDEITAQGGLKMETDGYLDLNDLLDKLNVRLSGSVHVDAEDMKVNDARFQIEGVGTGSVHAVETLYAKIEGVGKVRYTGNPKVTREIDGLGSVKRD